MKSTEILIIKRIAKESWRESFFAKRNTYITGFEKWWLIQQKKLEEREKLFKASIRFMLNETYGSKSMTIEAGARRYWDNMPGETDLTQSKNWEHAFISGAKSEESRQYWMQQFIKEEYLNSK